MEKILRQRQNQGILCNSKSWNIRLLGKLLRQRQNKGILCNSKSWNIRLLGIIVEAKEKSWNIMLLGKIVETKAKSGRESAYRPRSWRPVVLPLYYLQQTQDQHNRQKCYERNKKGFDV